MLGMDEEAFAEMFAGSPIKRLRRARWLRNVCVVLGNTGTGEDLPALEAATSDPDALVNEHAAWAVAEIEARRS
jgi:epoxyqueuosine reductase